MGRAVFVEDGGGVDPCKECVTPCTMSKNSIRGSALTPIVPPSWLLDNILYYYYYYYYKICIAHKFKRARVRGAGVARWGT